ncbi:hypothetical protein [Pseudactinotalea suaedae]|uniref:hypothetical protein n=1 Tax=Pseudactinotalea suaedae TaxID=1524924 RepID=UPI0012E2C9D4|nr:hypothetical protein [Pseudactinotalea suaedae]
MGKAHVWPIIALSAAMLCGTAACGVGGGGEPTARCTDETRTAGEPGDAEPLLFFGEATYAPTVVYADGAVVIPTAAVDGIGAQGAAGYLHLPMMAPGFTGEQPGGFVAGWLSDCELDVVIEKAEPLFAPGVDFGEPQITDQASTSFRLDGTTISLYAFDRSDPGHGIGGAQARARQDLADLWTLVEDATELTEQVEVDRLFVHTYGPIADEEVTDWPLATPISEMPRYGCTSVDDPAEVEAVLAWAGGSGLDDLDWRLAVVAAAPGVPDCEG